MIESLRNLFVSASIFLSMAAAAENLSEIDRSSYLCSIAITSSSKLDLRNGTTNTVPNSIGAYLNLLKQTLAEISNLSDVAPAQDILDLQNQILQKISNSGVPIDPFYDLAHDLSAATLFNQSYLLKLLIAGKTFQKSMVNLTESEWIYIKESLSKELSSIQAQLQTQAEANKISKDDFFEVGADYLGRVKLHYLVEERKYAEAIALLNHPVTTTRYVNTRDRENETPLDILIRMFPEIRYALFNPQISASPSIPAFDVPEIRSLFQAFRSKHAWTAKELVDHQMKLHRSILMFNVTPDDIDLAYYHGEDLDFEALDQSALSIAASSGNIEILNALLRYGVKINSNFKSGSPIRQAANQRQTESVKLLAYNGADLSGKLYGLSLPELAVHRNDAKTLRFLAEFGVNLHFKDPNSPNPIFSLNLQENEQEEAIDELFQVFRDLELDLSQANQAEHSTPAHKAVKIGNPKNLQALAKYGADLDKKDIFGHRPLHYVLDLCPKLKLSADPLYHSSDIHKHLFNRALLQTLLEIFYNYYTERGIPPADRNIKKATVNGKVTYQYLGFPKIVEGAN